MEALPLRHPVGHQTPDLLSSQGVDILPRHEALHLDRSGPTVASEAELRHPLIRPSRHNGLASRVARRVVVKATLGARFRVAAGPNTELYRIDRFSLGEERLRRNEATHLLRGKTPCGECIIETTPSAPMRRLQAERRERPEWPCREQGIGQLKQGILPTREGTIQRDAKGRESGKGWCIHGAHYATGCCPLLLWHRLRLKHKLRYLS